MILPFLVEPVIPVGIRHLVPDFRRQLAVFFGFDLFRHLVEGLVGPDVRYEVDVVPDPPGRRHAGGHIGEFHGFARLVHRQHIDLCRIVVVALADEGKMRAVGRKNGLAGAATRGRQWPLPAIRIGRKQPQARLGLVSRFGVVLLRIRRCGDHDSLAVRRDNRRREARKFPQHLGSEAPRVLRVCRAGQGQYQQ